MDSLDVYYRAFKDYRKNTLNNNVCDRDRRAIAEANTDNDKLEATKYIVKIEDDWIKAIEDGLEFVEKAVAEERQFITSNGEVVPIEKIRKVSKDSVVHLAKHSDMITHIPDDPSATIVPDELYMVEKLSDYAVYENRFLYMMLCYVRNFIEYRLEKIDALLRSYVGDMVISKEIKAKKRTLKIDAHVYEERTDNPYPIPDDECAKRVKRMSDCREIINSLLNTDLMQQVAKSPMIKPPIVKTNVLKMNNNFKNALALYDYIASYNGDGYSFEEVKFNFSPYTEGFADEIAEAANLMSFLAYKTGNKIETILETSFNQEEEARKREEEKKLLQRLERLKKRAQESEKTLEEYMLALEDRVRQLEKEGEELINLRMQVEELIKKIDELNAEKEELNRRIKVLEKTIEEKEAEIDRLNQKYIEDMAAIKKEHEAEIAQINADNAAQTEQLKAEFADQMTATINDYEARVTELSGQLAETQAAYNAAVTDCEQRLAAMQAEMQNFENAKAQYIAEYEQKLKDYEQKCNEALSADQAKLEQEKKECRKEVKKAQEETALIRGELDGIRIQQGKMVPSTEYTSRERFTELEKEYEAFQNFFKQQWEYTKKEIRKTILWAKNEKKKPING